jgi:uncharacterized membrane protein HdeD (DUF308 family)
MNVVTNSILKEGLVKSSKSLIIFGVLVLIIGILAVVYPASVGKISTIAIGIFLIMGGVFRLSFAFLSTSIGSMLLKYLYAFLMTGAGVWMVMNPDMGLEALTMVMAIYFIIDGITAALISFSLMPIGGGWYLLISGIIGVVLGIMIFSHWPESSTYVLGIYVGVKLISDGLMLALTGSAIRKVAK